MPNATAQPVTARRKARTSKPSTLKGKGLRREGRRVIGQAPQDPWLASLEYETANKALASVESEHGQALHDLLAQLQDMDRARLQV